MLQWEEEERCQRTGQIPLLREIHTKSAKDEKHFKRHLLHAAAVENIKGETWNEMVELWPLVLNSIAKNTRINESHLARAGHVYIYVKDGDVVCGSTHSGSLAPQLFWKVELNDGKVIQNVSLIVSQCQLTNHS